MLKSLWTKLLLGVSALLIVIVIGAGLFLSANKVLFERHRIFEQAQRFDFSAGTFQEYIEHSQDLLRNARVSVTSDAMIQNLSPFMLEPNANCERLENGKYLNGIVLTHGLLDSPYSMIDIGKHFQSRCFYVLGILLPDHGTRPGDMLKTKWQEWAEVQNFSIDIIETEVDNIFLSGHSAGGTLAIYGAATRPEIDGLILFAPALQITDAAKYAQWLVPIGRLFPKAAWYGLAPDEAVYRYESLTFTAASETYALIQETKKELEASQLSIPIFSVASVQDNTVSTEAILSFMDEYGGPEGTTLLYSQHPIDIPGEIIAYDSYAPQQGILSVSHLGLMTPDSHPYYGRDGAYRNCGHYSAQSDNFDLCKSGQRNYYGEASAENRQQGILERIAFNPFYADMLNEIDSFINQISD
jgi:esterase/lipase